MRAVQLKHLKDLARIAEGFEITGGKDTDDLYLDAKEYEVKRDNGTIIGHIFFDPRVGNAVFRPVHIEENSDLMW